MSSISPRRFGLSSGSMFIAPPDAYCLRWVSALPGDPTFSQTNNNYDLPAYRRICAEFGIDPSSDFRFSEGAHHGLGKVFIYVSYLGPEATEYSYPGSTKFSDEGGAANKGNLVYFIRNDFAGVERQFDFFVPGASHGLTQAGLARLNQSIEAFVYCVLGSQVNVLSSILGNTGSVKEAQLEFLVLMENAIGLPDISKSVRFSALPACHRRGKGSARHGNLPRNLAHALEACYKHGERCWLQQPAHAGGYNNQLMLAGPGMKLGVNNDVNTSTKKVGVTHMEGGPSKTNRPITHPSNPIHKAVVAAQSGEKTVQSIGKTVTESTAPSAPLADGMLSKSVC